MISQENIFAVCKKRTQYIYYFSMLKQLTSWVVYSYVFDNRKMSCICFQLTCHDPLAQDIGNDKARCISIYGKNNRVHYIQWISY